MKTRPKCLAANVAILALMALSPRPAFAQDDKGVSENEVAPATAQSDEIVVTARRVSESLQEAPAAITSLSAETLANARVEGLEGIAKLVPNLNFFPSFRQGGFQLSLRGVPTIQGGEASVAVLVDGVQAPAPDFINQDLLELRSVEVLRGPQGALYGRGAINGAILINTLDPGDHLENRFVASIGRANSVNVNNTLSGPLGSNLGFTLTAGARYTDGLIDNVGLGRKADQSRQVAARGKLVFKPGSATRIDLAGTYVSGLDDASLTSILPVALLDQASSSFPSHNLRARDDRELYSFSLKIEQETPIGILTSISQYAKSRSLLFGDGDFTDQPVAQQTFGTVVKAVNQDLRLSSSDPDGFRWLIGAFYQNRKTAQNIFVDGDPSGPFAGFVLADQQNRNDGEAYAVYGQVGLDLPAQFTLDAALRYDVDERRDVDLRAPGSAVAATFKALQPQLTLSKEFSDNIHAYATVGRGFRSGGFNAFTVPINIPGVSRKFEAEKTTNYEFGFKSQLLDRRLTVNLAVFHTVFDNQQVNRLINNPVALAVINVDSKIDGGEVEIVALPFEGLKLNASIGINNTRIKTDLYSRNRTPLSYSYTAQLGGQYDFPIHAGWNGLARIDYQRLGPIYYDPANAARYRSTQFVDASFRIQKGDLSIGIWGKNIFSEFAPAIYIPDAFAPGAGGLVRNKPASYGLEFRSAF